MGKEERKFDLEECLIDFTVMIADIVEAMPNTKAANQKESHTKYPEKIGMRMHCASATIVFCYLFVWH
jgi:hypothetical protein